MNKHYKSLAIAGLFLSCSAYASVPTSASSFQLVIPNLKSGLELSVAGLYLQVSNTDLDYGIVNPSVINNQATLVNNILTAEPDSQLGIKVGLGYIFPNSGNDVQLNWTSYNHSFTDSYFTTPGQSLSSGTTFEGTNVGDVDTIVDNQHIIVTQSLNAGSTVSEKLNTLDLDVGQFIDIGTRLRMRMYGGLRGAKVEQKIQDIYHNMRDVAVMNNSTGDIITHVHYKDDLQTRYDSTFKGLGPRFGVNSNYNVWNCFGITAEASTALLIGKVEAQTATWQRFNIIDNTTNQPISPNLPLIITTNSDTTVWRMVPQFDSKLGLNYSLVFHNQSALTFEAGYQVTQFINSVDKVVLGNRETSSQGFEGPYASLQFTI